MNTWARNKNWIESNQLRLQAKAEGKMYYDRRKPCKNGHFTRYTVTDHCVKCKADTKLKIRKDNPIHTKAQKTKHHLKFNYGISVDEYNALLLKQFGLCALCNLPETAQIKGVLKKLAVDHCHDTKKVRGLLCLNCNMGIGKLMHDPLLLRKAALYCEET